MADDVARMIVNSADTMGEISQFATIVTDDGNPDGFHVFGLERGNSTAFADIESADNSLHQQGFARLDEDDEARWMLSYNGGPLPTGEDAVHSGLTVVSLRQSLDKRLLQIPAQKFETQIMPSSPKLCLTDPIVTKSFREINRQ
jgi:hypothetical protein